MPSAPVTAISGDLPKPLAVPPPPANGNFQWESPWANIKTLPAGFPELESAVSAMPDLYWMVIYSREGLPVASTVSDVSARDGRAALLCDLFPAHRALLSRITDGEMPTVTLTSGGQVVRIIQIGKVYLAFSLSDQNSLEAAERFLILSVDRIWKSSFERPEAARGSR